MFPQIGLPLQESVREGGQVTSLRGRLAPGKGAGDTKLKLTWLADVRLFSQCHNILENTCVEDASAYTLFPNAELI